MPDLVEPLPVRNDRPGDDQATHREHDAGAAVLSLRKTVDLADHDLQRPVDLRVPVARHPPILLGPSTGHRPRTPKDDLRAPIKRYPSTRPGDRPVGSAG